MQLNKLMDGLSGQIQNAAPAGKKGSSLLPGLLSGVAGGALTSALLSKKGRKHLGGAAKLGGAAVLGGLAWKAYSRYQQRQPVAPAGGTDSRFQEITQWQDLNQQEFEVDPQTDKGRDTGLLLVRAMISAAHADGHLDAAERDRILQQASGDNLSAAERAVVLEELQTPRPISEIVAMVHDRETAIEVYLASALALDDSCQKGKDYLRALEFVLEIPPELVHQLKREISQNQPEAMPA